MNSRVTLIVVAVFLLLLGYVFFVDQDKPSVQLNATPTRAEAVKPYLFPISTTNVQSIQVRDLRAPREVLLKRAETGWQVVKPEQKAADDFVVTQKINQMITLQASRVLTNVTDLKPFGFVTATLEVRVVMTDTQEYGITVGAKTPGGYDYYAVYTGGKDVFVVSPSVIDDLLAWFDAPPYQPTPTPTFTPTPPVTPTEAGTPPATTAPPNIVPTFVPTPQVTGTPKP